jgi:hypothetical protein
VLDGILCTGGMSYWRFQALSKLNDLIMGKAPADQIERIDIHMPEAAWNLIDRTETHHEKA